MPLSKIHSFMADAAVPIGSIIDYCGVNSPSLWLYCYGQPVSRATYSDLFAAITAQCTGTTASSTTISAVSVDYTGLGIIGAKIEGSGIPAGATVAGVTSTTITISASATSSAAGVSLRIIPHGNGDGSTTFNIPDLRGRSTAGCDGMGGAAAGRLTSGGSGVTGAALGAVGGTETHTLTTAQMPSHRHRVYGTSTSASTPIGLGDGGSRSIDGNTQAVGLAYVDVNNSIPLVENTGSGSAHPNVQPTLVTNKIIYAGI